MLEREKERQDKRRGKIRGEAGEGGKPRGESARIEKRVAHRRSKFVVWKTCVVFFLQTTGSRIRWRLVERGGAGEDRAAWSSSRGKPPGAQGSDGGELFRVHSSGGVDGR